MPALYSDKISTYPGEYKPTQFDWDDLLKELHKPKEGNVKPSANIRELQDHYLVEIMAPGHSKDDFIVGINSKKQLSIVVMNTKPVIEKANYMIHEFNMDCFSQTIDLPTNIDTDFLRAEYKEGILSICFYKAERPTISMVHHIIIY